MTVNIPREVLERAVTTLRAVALTAAVEDAAVEDAAAIQAAIDTADHAARFQSMFVDYADEGL